MKKLFEVNIKSWWYIANSFFSDVSMFLFFIITWISPFTLDNEAPHGCMAILIMEFITIHSTVFLIYFAKRWLAIFVSLRYIPFIVGLWMQFHILWPFLFFGLHVYSTASTMLRKSEVRQRELFVHWGISFGLWIAAIFIAALIPWPGIGWNAQTVPDMTWSSNGRVVYHITPVWGVLYFLGTIIINARHLLKRLNTDKLLQDSFSEQGNDTIT